MQKHLMAALIALAIAPSAQAADLTTEKTPLSVSSVTSGLKHPWGMAFLPDGRIGISWSSFLPSKDGGWHLQRKTMPQRREPCLGRFTSWSSCEL